MGTCYLAADPIGCLVEVFRLWTLIPESELEDRRLSTLELPFEVSLADCTSSRSRVFGITAEIHSTQDYTLTWAWAGALRAAGFNGVHYYLRHDPGQRCTGVALFGPAGVADYPSPPPQRIGAAVLQRAEEQFGLQVISPLYGP